jgi:hypothetical protein
MAIFILTWALTGKKHERQQLPVDLLAVHCYQNWIHRFADGPINMKHMPYRSPKMVGFTIGKMKKKNTDSANLCKSRIKSLLDPLFIDAILILAISRCSVPSPFGLFLSLH